jgi:T1SS-143 domain-containing protein
MSIEDPRLSSIDNTSAADDFDSAVEQHPGFASEAVEGIEVAQAETPDAGRTDRLPAQPPVQTAAAVIPSEVTPNAQNVVTLPAGIELDNLEFEVDGDNLVLILADGTEIVVVGGAANIPTFVIGDVELPQVALFAALEGSNINVAAGPDGTFTAQGAPDASRNFQDDPIDAGPEDFALADLLGDTAFGDELRTGTILGDDGEPTILSPLTESFIYDEAVIADSDGDNQIITGTLPFEPGPDFGTITAVNFAGATNVDEGDGSTVLAGFTSGGRAITVTSFAPPADGTDLDFVALEGRDSEGNLVFTLTITNRETGDFTFELVGKLEHPDAGDNGSQDDLDDLLRLGFTYTVTDLDGDSVTGSFNIDVMDDAPTFGDAEDGAVDEDYLWNGNPNEEGEGDLDDLPPTEQMVRVLDVSEPSIGTYTSGSLGINWGADNGNAQVNAGLTGAINDRGVAFTKATVAALVAKELKSDGVVLKYALSPDGTTLVAYKPDEGEDGSEKRMFMSEDGPVKEQPSDWPEFSGEPVFIVSVSDISANGTYEFQLIGNLDHPDTNTEDDLVIEFPFTVQDGDGDTASSSFKVTVNDDSPILVDKPEAVRLTVDEDDIDTATSLGNAPNDGDAEDGSFTGAPGVNTGGPANATSTGNLSSLVKVGADENVSFSLINQADMRAYLEGLKLTSNGALIGYDLRTDGTIIAFVNAPGGAIPGQTYDSGDRLVFEFKLNGDGTFKFSLSDQLDHAAGNGENTLTIDFGSVLQANDGDGDSVKLTGLVKVDVTDDVPVIAPNAKPISIKVDEDDIDTATSLGNAPNDGDAEDGSFTGVPGVNTGGPANATSTGNLSSLVKVGADENVSFSLINQADMRAYLEGLKLTSNGALIGYDLRTDGTIIAFVNSPGGAIPGQTYDSGDRLVFEFKLNGDGTFKFSLSDQLDHAAGNGENTLTIDFGSVLQASDKDGDSVKLTGLVKVDVTDDVPVIAPNAKPISVKVDEDDIDTSTSLGTAPNDGDVKDGSFTGAPGVNTGGPANATSTGNLSSLVKVGADENVSFSLINQADMRAYLEGLKLTSNGALIGYDLRTDGTIIAFVNAPGGAIPGQTYDSGDRLVFEFKLNGDGTFKFSLSDQLDHAPGSDQNTLTIDFGSVLQASDKDGDSVKLTGLVKVDVTDDVPVIAPNAKPISVKVDEDDIDTSTSLGTSPNDGNVQDGSYTGTPATNTAGPANATSTGNLSSLVKVGADENVSFSLISQGAMRSYLEGLNLKSNGALIGYDLRTDGTIIAFVNAPGGAIPGQTYDSGDRLVFEFKLNSDGTFKFSLSDQLDHTTGDGKSLTIDFGSVLQANDKDGDSVKLTGLVKVEVTDDVPELVVGAKISRTVDEDDILNNQSTGTSPADGQGDGSWTGGPNQNGQGGAFIDGSLASLIKGGADDTVKFSFIDESALRQSLAGLGMSSKGEILSFDLQGNVLWGFANVGGPAGVSYDPNQGDRPVFKLTLNENGTYTFELLDQLDHDAGAGQNTGLLGSNADAIDFGSVIKATDFDGDSVVLKGAFSVTITDDVPVLSGKSEDRLVDEDDIDTPQSTGTSPKDGNADGSWTGGPGQNGKGGAFIDGSLAHLVKGGADDTVKFSFIDENAARTELDKLGLSSKGAELSYDIRDGVLYAFDNAGPSKGDSYDSQNGDRLVFKLTLNENGSYTFELVDQLDHDPADGQNTDLQDDVAGDVEAIDFGSIIKATDNDGDSVVLKDAFSITIKDDVPVLSGAKENRLVDEDDIQTLQSTGNNPNDGDGDGSFTGNPIGNNTGPAFISGSLAGLIKGGADDAVKFSFISKSAAVSALSALGLSSQGAELSYDIQGKVLYGYDNDAGNGGYGNGDRLVFKLTLEDDGSYTFELVDQLDHDRPLFGRDENTDLQDAFWFKDVEAIDFGAIIKATDNDGDSVSLGGAFSITIRDDVPELSGKTEARIVDEDDIENLQSTGTSPADFDADGSFTGGPGQGGSGPAFIDGSLADVVKGGADDNVKFSFIDETLARVALSALGLKSQGEALSYQIQGNSLIAYDNNGGPGYGNGDRLVFKLTLSEDGKYTFELADQLDHDRPASGADENYDLQDGLWFADVTAINFGALIKVTDNDGDSISLNGAFEIKIRDDIPEASIVTDQTVTIDETAGVQNSDTTDPAVAAVFAGVFNPGSGLSPIFAKADVIDTTFKTGSDENATTKLALRIDVAASGLQTTAGQDITLYLENGLVVGRVGGPQGQAAFAVAIDADGNVSVAQYTSLKHPDASATDEGIDLTGKISAVFSVKDFDGDVVTKSVSIGNKIVFEDDAPGVSSRSISVAVDEDGLPTGAADSGKAAEVAGTGSATVSGVAGTLTALFNFGADGAHATQAISLKPTVSPVDSGLNSQGGDVLIKVDGNTLTGYVAGTPDRVVFELKVNADGSYDFELKDQIDHPTLDGLAGDDTENLVLSNIDLSGYIVGKDGDGDTITLDSGKFVVGVQDDIPSVTAETVKVSVDQPEVLPPVPGKVANFVLVLDASGSTDLDRIKDQVEDFLEKLSQSGAQDVRVHIVEFGSDASAVGTYDLIVGGQIQSNVLQDALDDVNDVRDGGGTNYEAGLQQALQWIEGTIQVTDELRSFDANTSQFSNDTAYVIGNGTTQIALVSGWNAPGTSANDLDDAEGSVGGGWGVDDSDVDAGEILRFDFGAFNDFDGSGAYQNVAGFSGIAVTSATFNLDDDWSGRNSGATNFGYTIYFVGGGSQTGSLPVDNNETSLTLVGTGANAGKQIAYIEFTIPTGSGYGEVDLVSVTSPSLIGTLPNATVNELIFLSDGEPNQTNGDNDASASEAIAAIQNEINSIETDGDGSGRDLTFTIQAFGVGASNSDLAVLGQVEGTGGSSTNVSNQSTLAQQLSGLLGSLGGTPSSAYTPEVGTFNVASLVKVGADESITFSLKADTSGLPALKSGNTLLTYTVANNVLTAQAGALVVFTLSLAADGKVTFTLNAPIDGHGDKAIDFSSLFQAADFDGDAVSLAAGKVVVVVDGVPFGEAQSFDTQEDKSVSGTVEAIVGDEGGTFAITGNPANGTVVLDPQTGEFTYTPNENWHGTETFTVTVTDDDSDTSNPIVVTVNVASVNDAPTTDNRSASGDEDTTITVNLSGAGADVDGTVAGYVIKSLPLNGTLYLNSNGTNPITIGQTVTGSVYFKPEANYSGNVSFEFAAKDNLGLEDGSPATASITVNAVNDAPTTDNRSASGDEDTTITVNLSGAGADVDGTVAGYVIKSLPLNGTLYLNSNGTNPITIGQTVTGSVYFKPNANYSGNVSFEFAAKDNLGLEDGSPATASITVNAVNDAPTTDNRSASGDEDTTITVNLSGAGADVDGTVAGYVIKSLPLNGTLYLNSNGTNPITIGQTVTGSVYFKPEANYSGNVSFEFAAKDNLGLEDGSPATASITVNAVNDAPTTDNRSASGDEDTTITVNLSGAGADVDGTVAGYVIKSLPLNGTLYLNSNGTNPITIGQTVTGSVYFKPNANYSGNVSFEFAAKDNLGLEDGSPATASITVNAVNDAPLSTNDSVTMDEDTTKVLLISDFGTYSDVEASAIAAVKITSLATDGKLQYLNSGNWVNVTLNQEVSVADITAGKLRFVPDANESGNAYATIGFKVSDGSAFSGSAYTLTVNVTEVPDNKVVYREISAQDTLSYSGEDTTFALTPPGTPSGSAVLTIRGSGDYSQGNSDEYIRGYIWNGNSWSSLGDFGPSKNNVTVVSGGSSDNRTWSVNIALTQAQLVAATFEGKIYFKLDNSRDVDPGWGGADTFGVTLKANYVVPAADPIVLDLDKNGFAFSSIDNGVSFDIDADGKADQIAWTSDDGILAYDVDGDGVIDNGSEIFTPDFNGGKYASGVAALASLDSNGDGKIDADDDAFSKLQIWVDADNDGVSDAGELSSLTDHNVASISLTTDTTGGSEDGQTIFAEGEFTFDDGSTGNFVEVGFDTIFGSDASEALTVIGTDGDDVLHGGMGQVVMTGGAGADTFVFDQTALSDLDVADVITDFNSDEGDVLDVTALLDSLLGEQLTTDTAASHLRATVEDGNTTVSVQTATDTWKDVVVLQNHDTAIKVLFDDKHTVVTPHD